MNIDVALLVTLGLSHDAAVIVCERITELESELKLTRQRAVDAEMELLALKSPPIPDHIRAKMNHDRAMAELKSKKCEPPWLNQALNEGDGTYKP